MNKNCQLIKIATAAERLDASQVTVRRWIKRGYLSGIKFGHSLRIHVDDLDSFIARGRRPMTNAEVLR